MERLWGRDRIPEDFVARFPYGLPVADRVADLEEWALVYLGRLLLFRLLPFKFRSV